MEQELRDYFKQIRETMESHGEKLHEIHVQTIKTNGRVTAAEHRLDAIEQRCTKDDACPSSGKTSLLSVDNRIILIWLAVGGGSGFGISELIEVLSK